MIPAFESQTGDLPPGIHRATWAEIVARFGYNPRRLTLLAGLKAALDALAAAGCRRVYIDGSFVTTKGIPNDFDACWELAGVDFDWLDQTEPVLLDWSQMRAAQKARFGGELFVADAAADPWGTTYLDFFQQNAHTGQQKGIVLMDLEELP